ncbi:inorganic diphosphatase [Pontibacter sp. HSC-14F20]|uniref:inorganic diphosphatase n=1 Tax=Pontibacter sp. HSC-14F20 TaxID=2864136 RepID=UPI001C730A27|nr:inorganic diphosphatase [Pontibacter sp. HSC-14F20]MBX0334562.1 inorganic diphosphatase [Pontibacter sp. HSC-14F20]
MITLQRYTFLLLLLALLASCQTDYASLPTYNAKKQLQAVIEVPAGSAIKHHYNQQTKTFEAEQQAGQDRIISFLPYPANFGFIPSTETNAQKKPLEVVVLAGGVATGTVMEVIPVGVLQLETAGELDHKIIAVPARPSERSINAADYNSFTADYPAAKAILQQWFVHHNPTSKSKFVGWRNEQFAEQEIQRWMKL